MPKFRTDHFNIFAKSERPPDPMRKYQIKAMDDDSTDILLYGIVAWWDLDSKQFAEDLMRITTSKVNLRINSPGGNVFDGIGMYNSIKTHPAQFTSIIESSALSIMSVVALASETVKIAKNAFMMLHEPWSIIAANAKDLRKEADVLDKLSGGMAGTYMEKTGKSAKNVKEWMGEETWFNAQEAKDAGLVDEIIGENKEAKSFFDLSIFANVPEELRERINANRGKPTEREIEKILRDSGFSRQEAVAFVAGGYKNAAQRDSEPDWSCLCEIINKSIQNMKG